MFSDNYLIELLEEKDLVDPVRTSHSFRLLEQEIEKVKFGTDSLTGFKEEVIKLTENIPLPVDEFPRFNFVGKILGPKGSTLRGIQSSSKCKILILGQGSTRDQKKEEELRDSGDSQYEHFKKPLHLLVQTTGPKSEAYGNIASALSELSSCLLPDDKLRYDIPGGIRNTFSGGLEERGRVPQQPILRFGIPPPGAIIIDQSMGPGIIDQSGYPDERRHPRSTESPERDSYGITPKRYYGQSRETLSFDTRDTYRHDRSPDSYPVKKRKDNHYNESDTYSTNY